MNGLTHPATGKWFGHHEGGFFFRLVDGDHAMAVLTEPRSPNLVAVIPADGNAADPRPEMRMAARAWLEKRGRRAG